MLSKRRRADCRHHDQTLQRRAWDHVGNLVLFVRPAIGPFARLYPAYAQISVENKQTVHVALTHG
jgi:hypothetical protein